MGGNHLLGRLLGALRHLLEIGRELRIVVATGDGDPSAFEAGLEAARDQGVDPGLQVGTRDRHRIIGDHQRAHGGHRLDHAGELARGLGGADGRV